MTDAPHNCAVVINVKYTSMQSFLDLCNSFPSTTNTESMTSTMMCNTIFLFSRRIYVIYTKIHVIVLLFSWVVFTYNCYTTPS